MALPRVKLVGGENCQQPRSGFRPLKSDNILQNQPPWRMPLEQTEQPGQRFGPRVRQAFIGAEPAEGLARRTQQPRVGC